MKIYKIIKQVNRFESLQEEAPFDVWRFLSTRNKIFNICGGDIALTDTDGDFGTVKDWQRVISWMAKQFGGNVDWYNDDIAEEKE